MVIVEQALVVSHEIIRIAILWHEQWHEGLEEASRLYFTEKNPEAMIAVLEPLHVKLDEVCQTRSIAHSGRSNASRFRGHRLLARQHSHRSSDGSCLKHGKFVVDTAFAATPVNWTRPGTSTME